MRLARGGSLIGLVAGFAGISAAALMGYSMFTGQTLCSMVQCCSAACPEKASGGCEEKTAAKQAQVVEVKNTSAQLGVSKPSSHAACCAAKKALSAKADGCHSTSATAPNATAAEGRVVLLGSRFPVMVPAAFYGSAKQATPRDLVSSKSCAGQASVSSCSTQVAASDAKSGCCAAKAKGVVAQAGKTGAVVTQVSNTSAAAESQAADDGCCKGSGKRADGKACCGKCPAKAAEKTAEKPAESTGTTPVGSGAS